MATEEIVVGNGKIAMSSDVAKNLSELLSSREILEDMFRYIEKMNSDERKKWGSVIGGSLMGFSVGGPLGAGIGAAIGAFAYITMDKYNKSKIQLSKQELEVIKKVKNAYDGDKINLAPQEGRILINLLARIEYQAGH